MVITEELEKVRGGSGAAWDGFRTGLWQQEINVRDFIQQNYEPYEGDWGSWKLPPNARTESGSG